MAGFSISFENGSEDFVLEWQLIPSTISYRWLEKLKYISKDLEIDDNRRFYGLPPAARSEIYQDMLTAIYQLEYLGIEIANKIVDFEKCDKEWLNELHDIFANTHGRDHDPKSYLQSKELISAWNLLHDNIHRMESNLGREEHKIIFATWRNQGEFMELFSIYDFEKFTLGSNFGDIVLNYRQVGKSPYHVFLSEDKVELDVCVPSINWCADFKILLFDSKPTDAQWRLPEFIRWYDDNFDFFSKNFLFGKRDKRVGLGAYPLAKLKTSFNNQTIIDALTNSKGIKNIEIHPDVIA